jgi:hypothetical protein
VVSLILSCHPFVFDEEALEAAVALEGARKLQEDAEVLQTPQYSQSIFMADSLAPPQFSVNRQTRACFVWGEFCALSQLTCAAMGCLGQTAHSVDGEQSPQSSPADSASVGTSYRSNLVPATATHGWMGGWMDGHY